MRWSYGVTTVGERFHSTLPRTIASLAAAGFEHPRLFVDGAGPQLAQWFADEFSLPISARQPRIGLAANWCLSAVEMYLYDPTADRYAIFQDDILACRNLRRYLEACPYPERGYLNLFTFMDNERIVQQQAKGWLEGAQMPPGHGRIFHGHRQQVGRGALALVFSREALTTLFLQPHFVHRPECGRTATFKIDGGIVESMNQAGWREYIHNPSLVTHAGWRSTKRGVRWTVNAKSFPGEEFDAMKLLCSPQLSSQEVEGSKSYWKQRANLPYYAAVRRVLDCMGPCDSLLDVGCLDTPAATWGDFQRRYTIDTKQRPALPGVLPIIGTWPDCRELVPLPVSVVLCLQVLEHVADPPAFARELFAAADTAIILSVPWGWSAGFEPTHRHDPVDSAKLRQWTGRDPDELIITGTLPRAVAMYRI